MSETCSNSGSNYSDESSVPSGDIYDFDEYSDDNEAKVDSMNTENFATSKSNIIETTEFTAELTKLTRTKKVIKFIIRY